MTATQIVLAGSPEALLTAAAAIDADLLGAASRRILVVTTAPGAPSAAPEISVPHHRRPGTAPAVARFDQVVVLDELIRPFDPRGWAPSATGLPVLERTLRTRWDLGDDDVTLVLDGRSGQPSDWIAATFPDSPVIQLGHDLAMYGPSPAPVGWTRGRRTTRYVHLDRVPGLTPWALEHADPVLSVVPDSVWTGVLDEAAAAVGLSDADGVGTAVVLAENLSARGLLDVAEERHVLRDALRGAAVDGVERILVWTDPSHGAIGPVRRAVDEVAGVLPDHLAPRVVTDGVPADVFLAGSRPERVVGTYSSALLGAARRGATVRSHGLEHVKERLRPYDSPERIPHTVAGASLREGSPWTDPVALASLVDVVAFAMYPARLHERRGAVTTALEAMSGAEIARYPTMRRIRSLGFSV